MQINVFCILMDNTTKFYFERLTEKTHWYKTILYDNDRINRLYDPWKYIKYYSKISDVLEYHIYYRHILSIGFHGTTITTTIFCLVFYAISLSTSFIFVIRSNTASLF